MSSQQLQPTGKLKSAATSLPDSEARVRLAIKAAGIGVWDWNLETGEVSYSDATEVLLGLPPGSFAGNYEDFLDTVYLEDRDRVRIAIHSALEQEAYEVDYRIVWPDGSIHWIGGKGRLLRDETSKPVLITGTVIDVTDRKRVEEELRQSQAVLQLVIDNIPQSIFWKDRNSVYLGCNRNFAEVAGLENPKDVAGKTDYELPWKQEESDFFRKCDTRVMETDTPEYHIIEPQLTADGNQTWLDTNKIPLHDATGTVVGIVGTFEDVTVRKQTEEALQQANEALEIRVQNRTTALKDAIQHLQSEIAERKQADQALRRSEVRLRELLAREKLLNHLAGQIRNSLDLDTIIETAVQEIYNLLQLDRCLFVWFRCDGEQPYSQVVGEAKNSDLPSTIGRRNPLTQLGPLAQKTLNKQISRVEDTRAVTDIAERQFFLHSGCTAELALPIHTQSGEIGVIACIHVSKPRIWSDSEVELLQAVADQLAIAIDQAELYKQSRTATATAQEQATKLKLALHELQQTQTQLVQTEKMSSLGQLVAGVAHEINNPVNFIYGNLSHADTYVQDLLHLVELYQQHYPHPTSQLQAKMEAIDLEFVAADLPKLLASMKVGADRIRQIVLSLRNFSRLDEAEKKPVDIHEGLDNTLLILQHRLKAKLEQAGVQIIKEYGNLPLVECYAGQLNQVFMNILSNAIDAMEESAISGQSSAASSMSQQSTNNEQRTIPTIRICTELLDQQVSIRVADNGPGMTAAVHRRLFDPFFTTKPVGKGTGLGLAISHQIVVEKHGGQLLCISAPGQGAEFIVKVPVQQQF